MQAHPQLVENNVIWQVSALWWATTSERELSSNNVGLCASSASSRSGYLYRQERERGGGWASQTTKTASQVTAVESEWGGYSECGWHQPRIPWIILLLAMRQPHQQQQQRQPIDSGCCSCQRQHLLLPSSSTLSMKPSHIIKQGLSKSTISPRVAMLTVAVFVICIIGDSARLAEAAAASSRSGKYRLNGRAAGRLLLMGVCVGGGELN